MFPKRKVVVYIIGVQISISLAFIAFSAFAHLSGPKIFIAMGKGLVALMVLFSGPINLLTVSTFPIFATISTILCAGLAWLAIKRSSYLLTLCFLLTWYVTAVSGLVYAD